jgi:hypothetical protein
MVQAALYPLTIPLFKTPDEARSFRYDVWEWLSIKVSKEYPGAFSHAHRFQSESRMFLNSALPAGVLAAYVVFQHWGHLYLRSGLCGFLVVAFLFRLSLASERRRWLQSLDAARQLSFEWKRGNSTPDAAGGQK